jgi:hypothetical protein
MRTQEEHAAYLAGMLAGRAMHRSAVGMGLSEKYMDDLMVDVAREWHLHEPTAPLDPVSRCHDDLWPAFTRTKAWLNRMNILGAIQ